jgi:dienelactone hydrolase
VAWSLLTAGAQERSEADRREPERRQESILRVADPRGGVTMATTAEQWQPRREQIVAAMESVMGKLPRDVDVVNGRRVPPAMTVVEEVDCGSYVRQDIRYRSEPGCDTPAYLCLPKTVGRSGAGMAPAVLCLHPTDDQIGHGVVVGLDGKSNRQYAQELAERGYVTLSPGYPLLAGYQPDLAALGWECGTLKAVWDNLRAIDLLQSLPVVDATRIGAIGHSLGGHNAVYTAVFDDRILAVVSSCGLDSFRDYYGGDPQRWLPGRGWTQLRYMPRLADYRGRLEEIPFDFDQLLAALAPRAVMVIAPLHDDNFRADSVDRLCVEARKVYGLYGQVDRLRVLHPDCGHDFPPAMREAAYQMLDDVLRARP